MFSYERLRRHPRDLQRFTGLKDEQFARVLGAVEPVYADGEKERLSSEERQRAIGGGRRFTLSVADRLLMTLMYLRLYVTQSLLGYMFNLDDSNVNREINQRMLKVLKEVLPTPMQEQLLTVQTHAKKSKRISTLSELLEAYPEFKEVLLDATEQEVPKPKDKLKRKNRYSGKKKRHTLKTQVTVSHHLVLHLSNHVPGSVHDYTLLRATGVMHQLKGRKARVDKGYEGIEEAYPDVDIDKPIRAQRNRPLTLVEKVYNRILNSLRIPVEHTLAFLQKYGSLAGVYRNRTHRYDDTFMVVAGLSNFRILDKLAW